MAAEPVHVRICCYRICIYQHNISIIYTNNIQVVRVSLGCLVTELGYRPKFESEIIK